MNRRSFFTCFGAAATIAPLAVLLPPATPKLIEGVHFNGGLTLSRTTGTIIRNCSFSVPKDITAAITVTNCKALSIQNCDITGLG